MALTVRVVVEPMGLDDVAAVHEIEGLSFRTPWPAYAFEQELRGNRLARYLVARTSERVVGFVCVGHVRGQPLDVDARQRAKRLRQFDCSVQFEAEAVEPRVYLYMDARRLPTRCGGRG